MLDDFSISQKVAVQSIKNAVLRDKISHAYIIESNGYSKSLDFAKSFAKFILCPNHYSNNNKCTQCEQCRLIDKNEFLEFKLIESEGQWIKKAQLDELQELFSRKAILGNKKVYIINNAERLNISSANSILKFLEEPEDGIVAILVVENTSQLLSTIVSRCQTLSLRKDKNLTGLNTIEKLSEELTNNEEERKEYITSEDKSQLLDATINFIKKYEESKLNTIVYTNKLLLSEINDREKLTAFFEIMLLFYKDVLNVKLEKNVEIFNDYLEEIENISKINELDYLIGKINVIIDLKEKIKFNANINLLIDKLIIKLERCETDD